MACDVVRVRVRLRLRETRVLRVQVDTPSELRVAVESTVRRPRCPACGFRCARVHDTRRRDIHPSSSSPGSTRRRRIQRPSSSWLTVPAATPSIIATVSSRSTPSFGGRAHS